ncbi:MAG: PD-(D/E)XK nuclease family protein [Acidobacteriota bacterium]|nr:PD-(D/E)XK nuclease family protein [Acidobacteriota bacterium]
MGVRSCLPTEVKQALEQGRLVLTGNERAARWLREAYDQEQHAAGLPRWSPANILAWEQWTRACWRQLQLAGATNAILLNGSQEQRLWRSIIQRTPEAASVVQSDRLAELAAEAWHRLCVYDARQQVGSLAVSAETQAMQQWARSFQSLCRREQLCSMAELELELTTHIRNGADVAPEGVALLGFDRCTPAQRRLLEALEQAGRVVAWLELASRQQRPAVLLQAPNEQAELQACAQWLRAKLAEAADQPLRIGLVVARLDERRAAVERAVLEELAPDANCVESTSQPLPAEFAVGVPLASTGLGHAALQLLTWMAGPLPLEQVSSLLRSAFVADGLREAELRAVWDAAVLRRTPRLRPELTLEDAALLLMTEEQLPGAAAAVRALLARRVQSAEPRGFADWAAWMHETLRLADWGAPVEDSEQYQVRRRWQSALDELAALELTTERVPYAEALDELQRIARRTIFTTESQGAVIQVMSPEQSAGCQFDALWFLGAGNQSWPLSPSNSPLLPWALQRACGMPGTNVAADAAEAQQIASRTLHCADEVVFSYAQRCEAGEQEASAALDGCACTEVAADDSDARAVVPLERLVDESPLHKLPDEVLPGGAQVLQAQAACGFRAFATYRLRSTEPAGSVLGLSDAERGTLVHQVLERFWRRVQSQQQLLALGLEGCAVEVARAVDEAMAPLLARQHSAWEQSYLAVERERLLLLVQHWLEQERLRSPFVVQQLEQRLPDVQIGPLRLSVRVDRVDQVEGGELLLDYKTGEANPKEWKGDRPDAPQLPLYAIAREQAPLAGVAFAQVRAGKDRALVGLTTGAMPGMKQAKDEMVLEQRVETWREVLTRLAQEFADGDARVQPKQYPDTCNGCAQRLVCRLQPLSLNDEPDDDEEEQDG